MHQSESVGQQLDSSTLCSLEQIEQKLKVTTVDKSYDSDATITSDAEGKEDKAAAASAPPAAAVEGDDENSGESSKHTIC